jgi:hypothetical protein
MRQLTARLVAACFGAPARTWIFHYGGDCRIGEDDRRKCGDCDAQCVGLKIFAEAWYDGGEEIRRELGGGPLDLESGGSYAGGCHCR